MTIRRLVDLLSAAGGYLLWVVLVAFVGLGVVLAALVTVNWAHGLMT